MIIPSICCVVVLYKMRLAESPSFRAVWEQAKKTGAKVHFFIQDNSPEPSGGVAEYPGVSYRHCPGNPGLGNAYNAGARYAAEKGAWWLLLLDQDTTLPGNFLECYIRSINAHPETGIFVPEIFVGDYEQLSPLRRWKAQPRPLTTERTYPVKHYLLINSGLCVERTLFEKAGGFDENIWLDFADMQFVRRLLHTGQKRFYLMDCRCRQSFSGKETDIEKLKARFDIYLECARRCKYLDFADWAFRKYCMIVHSLSLTVSTRNAYFAKKLILRK